MSGKSSISKKSSISNKTVISEEEFEINEFLLDKFIALNPLYYIDEEEETEVIDFGFSKDLRFFREN